MSRREFPISSKGKNPSDKPLVVHSLNANVLGTSKAKYIISRRNVAQSCLIQVYNLGSEKLIFQNRSRYHLFPVVPLCLFHYVKASKSLVHRSVNSSVPPNSFKKLGLLAWTIPFIIFRICLLLITLPAASVVMPSYCPEG